MSSNPLSEYFRHPIIYIKLPSDGNFYPEGTLEMPENRELPVYPMTAIDEISYRTPDALFNGRSVVDVIQSCVPNIKNAWALPSIDLDSILIAIKIASIGHQMDINATCTECGNIDNVGVDLRVILDNLTVPDYNKSLPMGDLTIHFKPLNYRQMNDNNMIQFEEQKIYSALAETGNDATQTVELLSDSFKKLSKLTIKALKESISYIQLPDTIVDDPDQIEEFLTKADRKVFNKIKEFVLNLKSVSEIKPLKVQCSECEAEYDQPFTMDMSNFFD